jgi:hypothetical protein
VRDYADLARLGHVTRARLAHTPEASQFTSVYERIQALEQHDTRLLATRQNPRDTGMIQSANQGLRKRAAHVPRRN